MKEKRKMNRASKTCGAPSIIPTYMLWESQEAEEGQKGVKRAFEKMDKNFSYFIKNINLHIQDAQQIPVRINSKRSTLVHILIELMKENFEGNKREKQLLTYKNFLNEINN